MGYDRPDPYNQPEAFGLRLIGDVDYAGNYEFDIVALWKRDSDSTFFVASDAGCSCPVPFENVTYNELIQVKTLDELRRRLPKTRFRDRNPSDIVADVQSLVNRAREEGLR